MSPPSTASARKRGRKPRDADELHDALLGLGFLTADEVAKSAGWPELRRPIDAATTRDLRVDHARTASRR